MLLDRLLEANVKLVVVRSSMPCRAKVDSHQIEQLIMNLVIMVRDAMPQGGTIDVETSCLQFDQAQSDDYGTIPAVAYTMLWFRDTGCGMSQEIARVRFELSSPPKRWAREPGLDFPLLMAS